MQLFWAFSFLMCIFSCGKFPVWYDLFRQLICWSKGLADTSSIRHTDVNYQLVTSMNVRHSSALCDSRPLYILKCQQGRYGNFMDRHFRCLSTWRSQWGVWHECHVVIQDVSFLLLLWSSGSLAPDGPHLSSLHNFRFFFEIFKMSVFLSGEL